MKTGPVRLSMWLVCLLLAAPLALQAPLAAMPQETGGAAASLPRLFAFAQTLYESGEYYRAIGEFQRFLYFQPEHPLVSEAQLAVGLAYFCGERWLQAFEVFRAVTRVAPDARIRQTAALFMAEARAKGGDHPQAVALYEQVMRDYAGTYVAKRASYALGWSWMHLRQWDVARQAFEGVDRRSYYADSSHRLAAVLDPPPELPRRSPTIARALSTVIPGAGMIYAGHTIDGLISLGVHAALIAGTVEAISAGLEAAAAVSSFFTWGFYSTQRANAALYAQEFNIQAEERFIGQLAAQERLFLKAYARSLPCAASTSPSS